MSAPRYLATLILGTCLATLFTACGSDNESSTTTTVSDATTSAVTEVVDNTDSSRESAPVTDETAPSTAAATTMATARATPETSPATDPPSTTLDPSVPCSDAVETLEIAFENNEDLEASRFDETVALWADCNGMTVSDAYAYWIGQTGDPSDNPSATPDVALDQALSTIEDLSGCHLATAAGASTPYPLVSSQCVSGISALSDAYYLVFGSPSESAEWVFNNATIADCVSSDDGTFTFVECPVGDIGNLYNLYFTLDGANVSTYTTVTDEPGHDRNSALQSLAVDYLFFT